jgi:hypothetical protein
VAIYNQSLIWQQKPVSGLESVMIEEKEIPHYAMHVDLAKKEISCWIASEAEKVGGSLFSLMILFIPTNLGLFGDMVRTQRRIPNRR